MALKEHRSTTGTSRLLDLGFWLPSAGLCMKCVREHTSILASYSRRRPQGKCMAAGHSIPMTQSCSTEQRPSRPSVWRGPHLVSSGWCSGHKQGAHFRAPGKRPMGCLLPNCLTAKLLLGCSYLMFPLGRCSFPALSW